MNRVLFMVRRQYFDAIVEGTKTEEIRRHTKRWETIAQKMKGREPTTATFLCGRRIHRRDVVDLEFWESAEKYLRRKLSRQGRQDVGRGPVIVFFLGEAIPPA